MQYERNWPQSLHADRWCADLPVILRLPGRREQQVHLANFSVAGVRISGAAGMVEGEHASLDVGNKKVVAVSIVWVSGETAGCRFLGHADHEAIEAMMAAATSIDRTAIAPLSCEIGA